MTSRINKSRVSYLSFLLVIMAMIALSIQVYAQNEPRQAGEDQAARTDDISDSDNTYKHLSLFGDVFERVRDQYVDDVSDEQLIKYAINGMLGNLDPHSAFLDEEDFKDMRVNTQGEFGGLGIEVTMENGFVKVVSPIDDTPASEADIAAGDLITHLDGKPVIGLSLREAVKKMRGKVGTKIDLTIRREDVKEPIEVTIIRDIIKIRSVRHRILDDIGYIRITTFNKNTESGLRTAIDEIREQAGEDTIRGYVLDLRNNPGGLLNQAIAVTDAFLDQGEIVSTRGRNEEDTKRDNATKGDIIDGLPVIVLINGGSASASEIVAGALQDHRRAIVMGTQSFGKGSVQTVIGLPDDGAMRLTTHRYYTPSGRSIQAKGIEPDIIVEPAKIENIDVSGRIRESDLSGALDDGEVKEDDDDQEQNESNQDEDDSESNAEKEPIRDYQLSRAVDLLRGLNLYERRFQ